ncbi:MAG: 4Fe-4S binding protein [Coriobacteriia bacterium]|nr:4Fe-4S binding protein [Coriobacteriia bacterium]
MPSSTRVTPLLRNRLARLAFFFVGLVLFYGPFALVARLVGALVPGSFAANTLSDTHTICMRMPIGWLAQPWMLGSFGTNLLYLVPVIVLPVAAIALSPLFCGWLCPAGAFPEFLSRIVPDRFKFDLHGKAPLVPLRYGFFTGLLLAPFVTTSICCAYCNFTQMQNIASAAFGNPGPLLFISSTGLITMAIWLLPLGMFIKGGRGWCLFLCPAGALMSLASGATSRFPWLKRIRHDASACGSCATCEDLCPVRAIDVADDGAVSVNQYLCNGCADCVKACPTGAFRYGGAR